MSRIFCLFAICLFSACHTTNVTGTSTSVTNSSPAPVPVPAKPSIETLTYTNFDEIMKEGEGLQMAYFWATWCRPCTTIAPAIDNISANYVGRMRVGKLDVDEYRLTAKLHDVTSIPAFLFFKDGELVFQTSGRVTERYLVDVIDRLL